MEAISGDPDVEDFVGTVKSVYSDFDDKKYSALLRVLSTLPHPIKYVHKYFSDSYDDIHRIMQSIDPRFLTKSGSNDPIKPPNMPQFMEEQIRPVQDAFNYIKAQGAKVSNIRVALDDFQKIMACDYATQLVSELNLLLIQLGRVPPLFTSLPEIISLMCESYVYYVPLAWTKEQINELICKPRPGGIDQRTYTGTIPGELEEVQAIFVWYNSDNISKIAFVLPKFIFTARRKASYWTISQTEIYSIATLNLPAPNIALFGFSPPPLT